MGTLGGFRAGQRNPQAFAEPPPALPQVPAMKKANRERLTFMNWWWGGNRHGAAAFGIECPSKF
jgi:hypothetical protein